MVGWLAWFGVIAAFLGGAVAQAEIDHTLSMTVVQIQGYPGTGRVSLGSGVVVAPGRIATNCHVTQKAKMVVINKGGQQIKASTQRADVERDLCLLDAPQLQLPVASLGHASSLKVGETLYLYGYPRAIGMSFAQGHVQSLHAFKNSLVIETSAELTEGASGGGIFDDSGKLVGLATFFSAGHSGHNYAIPADWIAALSRKPSREIAPLEGLPFWQDLAHLPKFLRSPGL
jgi:S1-C subfamily serine protease